MNLPLMKHIGILLIVIIPAGLDGCGGGGGTAVPPPGSGSIVRVVVSPSLLAVEKGTSQWFTANAFDSLGQPVSSSYTWSLSYSTGATTSGSISVSGLYQAPSVLPDDNFVTVQATSNVDSTQWGSVSFFLSTGANVTFQNTYADITSVINWYGPPVGLKMTSTKGRVYLTWVATDQYQVTHLGYSVGDKNGSFSPPHDILSDITSLFGTIPPNPENLSITNDGNKIFIAWDDNISGYYQVYLVRGPNESGCSSSLCFAPFAATNGGASILADGGSQRQQNPTLSIGLKGNLAMAWETVGPISLERLIHYKELDAFGNSVRFADTPYTTNNGNNQHFPKVLLDLLGNVSVTWVDYGGAYTGNIFYSLLSPGQISFNTPVLMNVNSLTQSDSYSLSMNTSGTPYLAWSSSGGTSTTGIWTAYYSSGPPSFSSPSLFWAYGLESSLKIDLLNRSNLSWYDSQTQLVNFMKGDLVFQATSSFQTSGTNPVMDIDEGGRVNLMFTTSSGQNISTWFTRGE